MKMSGKKNLVIAGITTAVSVALLVGLIQFMWQPTQQLSESIAEDVSATNLGFSYIQITSRIAAYNDLEIESGALVTDVVANSPADEAGLQVGDIIRSFNGAQVEDGRPLLGMMMSCPIDHIIEMETLRGEKAGTVSFIHTYW